MGEAKKDVGLKLMRLANGEAEKCVLVTLLNYPEAVFPLSPKLSVLFLIHKNKKIFQALKSSDNDSAPALIDRLRQMDAWADNGGEQNDLPTIDYLSELQEAGSTPASLPGNIRLLNAAHKQRLMAGMGHELINSMGNYLVDEETVSGAEERMSHFIASLSSASEPALREASEFILDVLDDKDPGALLTGLKPLHDKMGGFWKQDVILLAGRPSSGKTAFALSLARNMVSHGPIIIFSLEMSQKQIAQRLVSMESGVPLSHIRDRVWRRNDNEAEAVHRACDALSKKPFIISDIPCTIGEIRAQINKIFYKTPPIMVILDYIQLIIPEDKRVPREQQISSFSRALKNMAKAFNCPFLVLSQLNRTGAGEQPQLHHLRESGALEQDADVVLAINHKEITTVIMILKHRNGPTGNVPIYWNPRITRFE